MTFSIWSKGFPDRAHRSHVAVAHNLGRRIAESEDSGCTQYAVAVLTTGFSLMMAVNDGGLMCA